MPARRDPNSIFTTIRLKKTTADRLNVLRNGKQTYDDILEDVLVQKGEYPIYFGERRKKHLKKKKKRSRRWPY